MRRRPLLVGLLLLGFLCAACGNQSDTTKGGRSVVLQLNWKPEPEFGPFYAAEQKGHFKTEGLSVEIRPGGSGAPTSDLVAAKQVPCAIVSADQIILARAVGKKIVGVFAVYQKDPMCFITHKARGFRDLKELLKAPGTIAVERGMPFATWIDKTIGFGPAKIVPSPFGDMKYLKADPTYAMQGFATSEPMAAERLGIPVDVFLVADLGFDTYQTVLAVHEDTLRDDPDLVTRLVRAVTRGFEDYQKEPTQVNQAMARLNPTMDIVTFAKVTTAQEPHMQSRDTELRGPGTMTLDRWKKLCDQMLEAGVIRTPVDPVGCFRDPVEWLKSR